MPSPTLCEKFLSFFNDKVLAIRSSPPPLTLDPAVSPVCSAVFEQFDLVSLPELSDVVKKLKPSQYPLDSIPPRLLKDVFTTIGSYILTLINISLTSGCVTTFFKHVVVQPLIKKQNLDHSVLSNFRLISKLPFLSKVLEKVVLAQLQSHLDFNCISEKFQSGFKSRHSTETALLRVFNDLI